MSLKHVLSVLVFSAFFIGPPAYSADVDVDKMRDEQCTNHYKQIDYFLQYLYRVDGNLKDLNPSKIKRIEHLDGVFSDYKASTAQRKAAFGELYTDPDWWVYKLQKNSRKLIGQLETMKKDSSWATYKKMATQQIAGQIPANFFAPSATKTMEETVQLINNTSEFFTERTE